MENVDEGKNGYHEGMHLLYVYFLDFTLFLVENMRILLVRVGFVHDIS